MGRGRMGREGQTDKRCHLLSIKPSQSPEVGWIELCRISKLRVPPVGLLQPGRAASNSVQLEKGAGFAWNGEAPRPKGLQKVTWGLWGEGPVGHFPRPLQHWEPR